MLSISDTHSFKIMGDFQIVSFSHQLYMENLNGLHTLLEKS